MFKKVTFEDETPKPNNIINMLILTLVGVVSIASAACLLALFIDYINLQERDLYLKKQLTVDGSTIFKGEVVIQDTITHLDTTNIDNIRITTINATTDLLVANHIKLNDSLALSDKIAIKYINNVDGPGSGPSLFLYSLDATDANLIIDSNGNIGSDTKRIGTFYGLYASFTVEVQTTYVQAATGFFFGNVQAATFNGVSDPQMKKNMTLTNINETLSKFENIKIYDYHYTSEYAAKFNKNTVDKITGLNSTQVAEIDPTLTNAGIIDLGTNTSPNKFNITYVDKLALIPMTMFSGQVALKRINLLKDCINVMKSNSGYSNAVINEIDTILNKWYN